MKTKNEMDFSKTMLMQPIVQLNLNNDDLNLEAIELNYIEYKRSFYSCVIKLLNLVNFKDKDDLNYIASNLISDTTFSNKDELLKALELERVKDNRDLLFIKLGFRAIEALLSNNLTSITAIDICQTNADLSPFFFSLKNTNVLLAGYFGYNNYCTGYNSED